MDILEPKILKNVFNSSDYASLVNLFKNYKNFEYQGGFSRYVAADNTIVELKTFSDSIVELARRTFNSNTLLPTYTLFAHYEKVDDKEPKLYHHKDDNACTYTIDFCLYQTEPWGLWVENKEYFLHENEALAYYGNDQEHWREKIPNPDAQKVAMIFFHFAEPDHWWFTKGRDYLNVIRGIISEEEWNKQQLIRKTINNV